MIIYLNESNKNDDKNHRKEITKNISEAINNACSHIASKFNKYSKFEKLRMSKDELFAYQRLADSNFKLLNKSDFENGYEDILYFEATSKSSSPLSKGYAYANAKIFYEMCVPDCGEYLENTYGYDCRFDLRDNIIEVEIVNL